MSDQTRDEREAHRVRTLMNRVVSLRHRLTGKETPALPEKFWPDAARDIFLVTYPRSGTTWISCVAAELLFQISPKSLTEIDSLVPDVHVLPEKSAVPVARQYLIKSHCPFRPRRELVSATCVSERCVISRGFISIRPSGRPCCVSTKRAGSKCSTARNRFCPCVRGKWSGTA